MWRRCIGFFVNSGRLCGPPALCSSLLVLLRLARMHARAHACGHRRHGTRGTSTPGARRRSGQQTGQSLSSRWTPSSTNSTSSTRQPRLRPRDTGGARGWETGRRGAAAAGWQEVWLAMGSYGHVPTAWHACETLFAWTCQAWCTADRFVFRRPADLRLAQGETGSRSSTHGAQVGAICKRHAADCRGQGGGRHRPGAPAHALRDPPLHPHPLGSRGSDAAAARPRVRVWAWRPVRAPPAPAPQPPAPRWQRQPRGWPFRAVLPAAGPHALVRPAAARHGAGRPEQPRPFQQRRRLAGALGRRL